MRTVTISQLYHEHVKSLTTEEQLHLVSLITKNLASRAQPMPQAAVDAQTDIMDLHGLGAEIWQDVDAQTYVNNLRAEWDS